MSKYVSYHLQDLAMDLIVEHVRKKYGVTEAKAIYGPGQLSLKLMQVTTDFNLYVVGHGACDGPVMMRKTQHNDSSRSDRLNPRVLAEELYHALPEGVNVNIKLAMCDGATEHSFMGKEPGKDVAEKMKASFASLTAKHLSMLGWQGTRLDVSKIFIGGAEGAAYWDKDPDNAPRYKHVVNPGIPEMGIAPEYSWEKRSRKYFCPAVFGGLAPIDAVQLPQGVNKIKTEETYCYFPFLFELKKPLEPRH